MDVWQIIKDENRSQLNKLTKTELTHLLKEKQTEWDNSKYSSCVKAYLKGEIEELKGLITKE